MSLHGCCPAAVQKAADKIKNISWLGIVSNPALFLDTPVNFLTIRKRINKKNMGIVSDDATILKIKHEVLTEVAKLAFAGELDEKKITFLMK